MSVLSADTQSLQLHKGFLYDMQDAVDKLFADVAHLAAPGSSFLFDFLHLDALQGLSHPVGYANTAKVLCMHAYTCLLVKCPVLPLCPYFYQAFCTRASFSYHYTVLLRASTQAWPPCTSRAVLCTCMR